MTADDAQRGRRKPNFVLVLCDDLGYGDVEPYGGTIPTPTINRMASEGLVATDFYAPANLCSPSRAGFLSGRYPIRSGLGYEVIFQGEDRVFPLSEPTIPRALGPEYTSALFGKWHLGHAGPTWLPTNYGFDRFFGIPYSHDMLPLTVFDANAGGAVHEREPEFSELQQQFYAQAERFIEANRDRPFFVQLALSAPHLPEYPTKEFRGTSNAGPYGDVIREIDDIVGRLLLKLRQLNLQRDTFVFFTSDNGPWFEGSSSPLRDRKGAAGYDGGY
ncbi:MAG: sulfatase-like hydrolase/transferase, partial [Hyphomicrobiales bacterium]